MEDSDYTLSEGSIAAKKASKHRSNSRPSSAAAGEVIVNGRLVEQLEEQSRVIDDDFADLWHDDPNLFRRDPRQRSVGAVDSRLDACSPARPGSAGSHSRSRSRHGSPASVDASARVRLTTRLEDHVEALSRKLAQRPSVVVQHQIETDAIKADLKRATKQAEELQRSLAKETKARATRDMSLERKARRLEQEAAANKLNAKQGTSDLFELMAANKDLQKLLNETHKQMADDRAYFLKVVADEKSARLDVQGLLELAESKLRKTEAELETKIEQQRSTIERLAASGEFYSADGELLDASLLEVRCRELEDIVHDLHQERNSVAMEARSSLRTQFEQVLRRAKREYENLIEETNSNAAEKLHRLQAQYELERQAKETQTAMAHKFQQQFEDMRHTGAALEVSIQRLQALYEKHTHQIGTLTADNDRLRDQLGLLSGDRDGVESQSRADKARLEADLDAARTEMRILKTELQGTIDTQATELAQKGRFQEEAAARIASLTQQLERARADLQDAVANRVSNGEVESAAARQLTDRLSDENRVSKSDEQTKLLEELSLFKSITTNYAKEVERLKTEINELQAQNKALQQDKRVLLSLQQMEPASSDNKPAANSWLAKQEQRFKTAARLSPSKSPAQLAAAAAAAHTSSPPTPHGANSNAHSGHSTARSGA
eukprot:TRINITY_DN505_c0_g1_i1.p1 TRINITY_DN505_c0_g1~~TRINITY_DN505_c0_g1_i1.p1  ORF type:complete len:666 (-),score=284.04 TRINITY_DN505_c0_g1_i1:330-2327(-)